MIISFSNTPLVMASIVGILILASHILPVFMKGRCAEVVKYIGIPLHLGLFVLLFFAGAELDLMVLALMVSVFTSALVGYISYLNGKGEAGK